MPEEFFDVAYINFDKTILHGRITVGKDEYGCRKEASVEQVLTEDQKKSLRKLQSKHHDEIDALLSSFVRREDYQ